MLGIVSGTPASSCIATDLMTIFMSLITSTSTSTSTSPLENRIAFCRPNSRAAGSLQSAQVTTSRSRLYSSSRSRRRRERGARRFRPNEISAATGAVRTMSAGRYRRSLFRDSWTRCITEETALVSLDKHSRKAASPGCAATLQFVPTNPGTTHGARAGRAAECVCPKRNLRAIPCEPGRCELRKLLRLTCFDSRLSPAPSDRVE